MFQLTIGGTEYYDEKENRFVTTKPKMVKLEHSLRSLAKWESKWKKSFLSSKKMTREESLDYIWCMEVTGQVEREVFDLLLPAQIDQIDKYIADPMTATTINRRKNGPTSRKIITAEIIYFWMFQNGIPMECDKWHLNRLLMLIEVCSAEGGPKQKMSMKDQMAQQRAINESRKKKFNTRG